jgi:hypothetical protein
MFTTTPFTTKAPRSWFSALRQAAIVTGLCACLGVGGLGMIGQADARVPDGDRVGHTAVVCGDIQDQFDELVAEQKAAFAAGDAEEAARLSHLILAAMDNWDGYGCGGWYGEISARRIPPPNSISTANSGVLRASPTTPSKAALTTSRSVAR